jgi:hypothetical protein
MRVVTSTSLQVNTGGPESKSVLRDTKFVELDTLEQIVDAQHPPSN